MVHSNATIAYLGLEVNADCQWYIRPKYNYRNNRRFVVSYRIVAKNRRTNRETPEIGDFKSELDARICIIHSWNNGTLFPKRILENS